MLNRTSLVVVRPADHGQQWRCLGFAQRPGLGGGGGAGPDRLLRDPQVEAVRAEQVVQPLFLEILWREAQQVRRDVVTHDRERLGAGAPEPLEDVDRRSLGDAELERERVRTPLGREAEHPRVRIAAGLGQVVVEAGQLDLALHLGVDHLRPHAALADQQPLVDEVLDRLAHRRPGQAQPVGQVDLVLEPCPRRQFAGLDEVLQVLCHLEVERDRAVPVHLDGRGDTVHDYLFRRPPPRRFYPL